MTDHCTAASLLTSLLTSLRGSLLSSLLAGSALALAAPAIVPATAQSLPDPDDTAQGDIAVTIYQNNQALVEDVRQLNIPRGTTRIAFPDVSAQIRPQTLSFSAEGTAIVEQNFDFDLLTPQKLMEKAIGETVTLIRTNPATGTETTERAEVLSTAGGVVIRIGDRIEVLRDDRLPVRVVFDEVPPNLRARPTLSVTLNSNQSGTREASIRYLTPGLGWSSDYVALYDASNSTLDMQGWVTLTNDTGTTFHNAETLLVAGDIGDSRSGRDRPRRDLVRPGTGTATADRERLGDFYLYPIAGETTIANAQTKQVGFLDVQDLPARRVFSIDVGWLQNDDDFRAASSAIRFNSSSEGGLGDALPAGTVRFYQNDRQGNAQFIGENTIGHTPMGSTLNLRIGDAFDVFVQTEVESRERLSAAEYERSARYRVIENGEVVREIEVDQSVKYFRTIMRYTFTNAKSEPVTVDLLQNGLARSRWARDYRVIDEDVEGEQINFSTRRYQVTVPANGERVVRVTYETKF